MKSKNKRRFFEDNFAITEKDETVLRFASSGGAGKGKKRAVFKKLFTVLVIAIVLGLTIVSLYAGFAAVSRTLLWENNLFQLKELNVKCHGEVLTKNHIIEYGKLNGVNNIFGINLAEMRKQLLTAPRIKDVEIKRTLPDSISVTVWERLPVARLDAGEYFVAIDREGIVLGPAVGKGTLPIIFANVQPGITPGTSMADTSVMHAIRILELCDTTPLGQIIKIAALDVRRKEEIDITLVEGTKVKLTWQQMNGDVALSRSYLEQKLMRLAENLKSAFERHKKIVSIDMRLENNFPAIESETD
jgi:cell division septal protein FtsQ